jgi:TonB family protein
MHTEMSFRESVSLSTKGSIRPIHDRSIRSDDGPPALPCWAAVAFDFPSGGTSFHSTSAMTRMPRTPVLMRASIAFCMVLAVHVAIYQVMARPPAAPPIESVPPAMQAMLLDENPIIPPPIPELRLSVIPIGALNIPVPDVIFVDPSAVPLNVERPVDLPIAKAATDSKRHDSLASAIDEQVPPHFDQGNPPLPAEVIPPHGSAALAGLQMTIKVWVEPSGRVSRAYVVHSSGAQWLDLAATQYARGWSLVREPSRARAHGMWAEFTLLIASDSCCTTLQPAQL